ncbi:tail fiber domain-containing protein [Sorangium sp. So ce204]|uniref:tail fiber domain-containing protein n=1 Tax=Sorangium sp. So ce204 TaxID=3133288 RepID=UPI003F6257C5
MVTSRVRYFDGQYLKDQDFIDEQNHHTDRRHRHERLLHVAGILEGLNVTVNAGVLTVSPGAAVDDTGRQILLETARTVNVTPTGNGVWRLRMLFDELGDRIPNDNLGAPEATRFKQAPIIEVVALNVNVPHQIVLGTVRRTAGLVTFGPEGRSYSGARFPGPNTSFTLRANTDGITGGVDLSTTLSVGGNLNVLESCSAQKLNIDTLEESRFGSIGVREFPVEGGTGREFVILTAGTMNMRAPSFRLQSYAGGTPVDIDSSGTGATTRLSIDELGRVGIGMSPNGANDRLGVNGNVVVYSNGDNLTLASGAAPSGGQFAESFIVNDTSSPHALVLVGNTSGSGGRSRVEVRQDLKVTGNLTTDGSASAGALTVSGNTTLGNLTANGNTTLGNLTVDGLTTFTSLNSGPLGATSLSVTGDASLGLNSGSKVTIGNNGAGNLLALIGNVRANGSVVLTSTAAVKDRIQALPAQEALSVFRHLAPVTYAYKDDPEKRIQAGFIAEDVPELVGTPDRTAIAPFNILAVLTRVVQAHDQALQALERRLDAMKGNPVQ